MKTKARVDVMAAITKVWPTICWLGRAMVLGSLQCLGVLLFGVFSMTGTCCACILSSILSSFFFSLSPRTRLGLTTMLSTGPLTRL